MKNKKRVAVGIIVALILIVLSGGAALHHIVQYPAPAVDQLAKTKVIKTFPKGSFVENVAIGSKGQIYATVLPLDGNANLSKIWIQREDKSEFYVDGTGGNIALTPENEIYSTAMLGDYNKPESLVFRLDHVVDKSFRTEFTFPMGAWINGIAFDDNGNLFAADSRLGCIWILTKDHKLSKWIESEKLAPKSMPGIPGANGIRYKNHQIWTVNSSTAEFLKVPIKSDGSAGELEVLAAGVPGDGFAISENGSAYFATHPFNTITEVKPNKTHTTIGKPENGIVGATDVAIDLINNRLIVSQDGGLFLEMVPPFARWLFGSERSQAALIELQL